MILNIKKYAVKILNRLEGEILADLININNPIYASPLNQNFNSLNDEGWNKLKVQGIQIKQ